MMSCGYFQEYEELPGYEEESQVKVKNCRKIKATSENTVTGSQA